MHVFFFTLLSSLEATIHSAKQRALAAVGSCVLLDPYSSCSQSIVSWPAASYHLLDMQKPGPTPSETVVGSAVFD